MIYWRKRDTYVYTNPEARRVVEAFQILPSATRKGVIDTLMTTIKDMPLDGFWMLAAHTEQAATINWMNPGQNTLQKVGTVNFVVDRGTAGDGSTGYWDSGLVMNALTNYAQDDAHMSCWVRTDGGASSTAHAMGFNTKARLLPHFSTTDQIRAWSNTSGIMSTASPASNIGHFIVRRTASNAQAVFQNGSSLFTDTDASEALGTDTFEIHSYGGGNGKSTHQILMASVGASLSGVESAFYTALNTYKTAVGA